MSGDDASIWVYPTETYYGLGCSPFSETAVQRILAMKSRPSSQGLPLIANDRAAVDTHFILPASLKGLTEQYWPGPLTVVLAPKNPSAFAQGVLASDGTAAVRVSSCVSARQLAKTLGGLVISTSANERGGPPSDQPSSLPASLLSEAILVDGGKTAGGEPSTIVALDDGGGFTVLRAGAVKVSLEGLAGE